MKRVTHRNRAITVLVWLLLGLLSAAQVQAKLIPGFFPGWKKYERWPAAPRQGNQNAVPPYAGNTWTESVTGMEFVWVPGGCFQMGSPASEAERDDDETQHEVCLDGYWLGKTEVTQGQWQRIMGSNPSRFKNGDTYPVEQVSWNDAQDYIRKLGSRSGKRFRLPTEAEWEYAVRSGGKDEKYAGGDNLDAVAWYKGNSGGKTHPVAQKWPNGLGLYDMSGNVREWCSDSYGKDYYSNSPRSNPQGPSSGASRVVRGGGWGNFARYCRSAYRGGSVPCLRYDSLGFRLVLPAGQ